MSEVPHFPLHLNAATLKSQLVEFWNRCFPSWEENDIQYKQLSGGYVNCLVHCFRTSQPLQGVVIRIYSDRLDSSVFGKKKSRDKESYYCEALSAVGCFPRLIARFENGYCYEFYDGIPLNTDLNYLSQEKYISAITKAMSKMHCVQMGPKTSSFIPMLYKGIEDTSEENFAIMRQSIPDFPCKTELLDDLHLVEDNLIVCGSPLVICHGDMHTANLLWNGTDDHVKVIDCEFVTYNYQAHDIGYHFIGFDFDPIVGDQTLPITEEEYQRRFIKSYLGHWFEGQGRDPEEVSTSDIERLLVQSKKGMLGHPSGPFQTNGATHSQWEHWDFAKELEGWVKQSEVHMKSWARNIEDKMKLHMRHGCENGPSYQHPWSSSHGHYPCSGQNCSWSSSGDSGWNYSCSGGEWHPGHSKSSKSQNEGNKKRKQEQDALRKKMSESMNKAKKNRYEVTCRRLLYGEKAIELNDLPTVTPDFISVLLYDIDPANTMAKKKYLKKQQVFWHPDKFSQLCGQKLSRLEKKEIMERVKSIFQAFNEAIKKIQ